MFRDHPLSNETTISPLSFILNPCLANTGRSARCPWLVCGGLADGDHHYRIAVGARRF